MERVEDAPVFSGEYLGATGVRPVPVVAGRSDDDVRTAVPVDVPGT